MNETSEASLLAVRFSRRAALVAAVVGLLSATHTSAACSPGLGGNQRANVKDFGAIGNGSVDDGHAIAAAIESLPSGGIVEFPAGRYLIGSEVAVQGKANLHFTGSGATIASGRVRSCFSFSRCRGIGFSNLAFDARGQRTDLYTAFADGERQVPIRFIAGRGLEVANCTFEDLYTAFVLFKDSTDLRVSCCQFSSPLQQQDQYLTFVEIAQSGGKLDVLRNRFYGAPTTRNDRSPCAVCASGITGALTIAENRAEHCGRNNAGTHRLGVFDLYADATNVTVANNVALNCREQFMRVSTTVDADIHDNIVTVAPEADRTYSTMVVESGSFTFVRQPVSRRITIRNNTLIDSAGRQAFAIGILAHDWGAGNETIRVLDNIINGQALAVFIAGPFDDIQIRGNRASNVTAFVRQTLANGPPMTSDLGVEADARFDRLLIEDNVIDIAEGSRAVPVSLSTHAPRRFEGKVGTFAFRGNVLRGRPSGTDVAVSAIFNASSPQGQFVAEDNEIAGYATPFYLRSMAHAALARNKVGGLSSLLLSDGTVGSIETDGNIRSSAALSGLASLPGAVPDIPPPPDCSCI